MISIILEVLVALILFAYIFSKLTCGVCKSNTCLIGKTTLITGGNSGIGFQVAKMLAARGCRIIIADIENCEKSKMKIIEETNNPNIVTKYLNLASFKSVRSFADDILKTEKRLDILINNAGTAGASHLKSEDGLNPTLQINYFGPVLLTHLLIDLLKKSEPSRIIFTSSNLCYTSNLTVENMSKIFGKDKILLTDIFFTYSNSKLATVIASNEIAKRLRGTKVTSNSLHPGFTRTDIFKKMCESTRTTFIVYYLVWFAGIFSAKDVWEAAQTTIHLATSKELENVTGKFFQDCKEFIMPKNAKDEEFCKAVFEQTEKLIQLNESEKLKSNESLLN